MYYFCYLFAFYFFIFFFIYKICIYAIIYIAKISSKDNEYLRSAFDKAINESIKKIKSNSLDIGTQLYIDKQKNKNKTLLAYHYELIFPVYVNLSKYVNKNTMFVIPLKCDDIQKRYIISTMLTKEMAYNNVRIIDCVNLQWLKYEDDRTKMHISNFGMHNKLLDINPFLYFYIKTHLHFKLPTT